jgi:hypothetical protein
MDITKADLEERIAALQAERERVVAQTIGVYDGAIEELGRWLLVLESQKTEK